MRAVNRLLSSLLGLVLIAGGLLIVASAALVLADHRPWPVRVDRWHRSLSTTTVSDNRVLVVSIIVGVVGLLLLIAELRRWTPDRLLAGAEPAGAWWLSRRSVEHRLGAAATAVSGVSSAKARVRGTTRRWRLHLRAQGDPDRQDALRRAVQTELDRLGAPPGTAVRLRISRARRVV